MNRIEVIVLFDIGKTNKKAVLFDRELNVVEEKESIFNEVVDDDGFPCDDAEKLESWIDQTLAGYLDHAEYEVKGMNFSTYGATLVFLDETGQRCTPIYNYLKPLPEEVMEGFYDKYGGLVEFSRRTASPALGLINSGLQILWLKKTKPEVYQRVKTILHLPQYLSFRLTGKALSEHTSVGCHTVMWDFDHMKYHPWIVEEGISLPEPGAISEIVPVTLGKSTIPIGKGIHDSSASLAPYIIAAEEPFILVSTGTWCINMNPFNHEPLTADELSQDCLCFLSVKKRPVKSSRFFLGRIHDINVERLESFFKVKKGSYKGINPGREKIHKCWLASRDGGVFFKDGIPEEYLDRSVDLDQYASFEEAYIQLMVDLSRKVVHSIELIIPGEDNTKHLYITGGFAKNPIFTTIMAIAFSEKRVFTSEVDNATSLGAALVIANQIWEGFNESLDLGLKEVFVT